MTCSNNGTASKFIEVSYVKSPQIKVTLYQASASKDSQAYNLIPNNVENHISKSTQELQACIAEIVDTGLVPNQLLDAQQALNDANDPSTDTQSYAKEDFINTCDESTNFAYRI